MVKNRRRMRIWSWLAACAAGVLFVPAAMAQLPGGGAVPLPTPPDVSAPATSELPTPEAKGDAETDVQGEAESQVDSPQTGEAKSDANADTKAKAKGQSDIAPDADLDAKDKVDADAGVEAGAEGKADAGAEGKIDAGAEDKVDAGAQGKIDAGAEGKIDAGAEGNVDAEGRVDADAHGELKPADAKPRLDTGAQGELRGNAATDQTQGRVNASGNFGAQVSESNGRLVIGSIAEGSAAATAGLQMNDLIVAVNGKVVSTNANLTEQLRVAGDADGQAEMIVLRDGQMQTFVADVSGRSAEESSAQASGVLPPAPNGQPYTTFYRGPNGEVYSSQGYQTGPQYYPRRGWRWRRCR